MDHVLSELSTMTHPSWVPFSVWHLTFFFPLKLIHFWLCWVFVAVLGPPLVAVSRGYSLIVVCKLLVVQASPVAEHSL